MIVPAPVIVESASFDQLVPESARRRAASTSCDNGGGERYVDDRGRQSTVSRDEVASSQPATARATLAVVSSNRRLVTAEQLDAMSPNERAAALAEHIVMDLDELPEGFRERVVATGQRLATERDQAATG